MLRTSLAVLAILSLSTSLVQAQSAWTGGDDLPTSPLACDGTPATPVAKPYDGGMTTSAPDRNGKPITVVDVPFDIKLSRTFCAIACLCGDCYTWIRWPDPSQTASFNDQMYTNCTQCAKKKLVEETHPKQNPADKKRAAERFLQDALKKLAKKD